MIERAQGLTTGKDGLETEVLNDGYCKHGHEKGDCNPESFD